MPGEIENSKGQWEEWIFDTYSLDWDSRICSPCMSHAVCEGKTTINLDDGYWRLNTNSTTLIHCPNVDACLGGYEPQNQFPVKWATGYDGYLCTQWAVLDDVKYQPLSNFQWSKWPNSAFNLIRIIGVVFLATVFLSLLIYINLRKRKENQMSILFRILTNYIHLISASMSFSVKIPTNFSDMFSQFDRVSSPDETFFSFDWFIEDYEIKAFAPSNSLFKLFLYLLLPVVLIAAIALSLVCLKYFIPLVARGKSFDLKRAIVVSMVCVVFLFHPTLTIESLSVFTWNKVDEGDSRMTHHMEYSWYSFDHLKWWLLVGLPILVVWVFGCPLIAFLILTKERNHLDDWRVKKYFLVIYQGLRKDTYYWEFVNTFRKFLILAISALMNSLSINYRLALSVGKFLSYSNRFSLTHILDTNTERA